MFAKLLGIAQHLQESVVKQFISGFAKATILAC